LTGLIIAFVYATGAEDYSVLVAPYKVTFLIDPTGVQLWDTKTLEDIPKFSHLVKSGWDLNRNMIL
jgi:hypothetical protein